VRLWARRRSSICAPLIRTQLLSDGRSDLCRSHRCVTVIRNIVVIVLMTGIMLAVAAVLISFGGLSFRTIFADSQVHSRQKQQAVEEEFDIENAAI